MTTPAEAWERYAANAAPRRGVNAAGALTWLNWTQYPDHGPDEAILGTVYEKRVVELGCGTGANLAHLATLGARCVGVDIAPSRTTKAVQSWGHLPNLTFVTADAVDHLAAHPGHYDVACSIFGAVWFTPPDTLLPLVHEALAPGGVLVFSHLPASRTPAPNDRLIKKQELSIAEWVAALSAHGFEDAAGEFIAPPACDDDQRGTLLVRARRA